MERSITLINLLGIIRQPILRYDFIPHLVANKYLVQ